MRVTACVLALASSALAYSVITPNSVQGWTNQGGQPFSWTRVDTDPLNFTALLTNQQIQGFTPQILAALVDGTVGKTSLNPPSGGWPTGTGFRLNLVFNDTELDTILAQSPMFNITEAIATLPTTTTAAAAGTSAINTGAAGVTTPTTPNPTTTATGPVATDSILPTKNAAVSDVSVNGGLLGLFSLLGFILA